VKGAGESAKTKTGSPAEFRRLIVHLGIAMVAAGDAVDVIENRCAGMLAIATMEIAAGQMLAPASSPRFCRSAASWIPRHETRRSPMQHAGISRRSGRLHVIRVM
jgi:hypothetical protein